MKKKYNWSVLIGAAFLMASSAIGPGFLTQTAVFTEQLGASFAFVVRLVHHTRCRCTAQYLENNCGGR
ncbi:hypothetical protein [Pedobacter sp. UC225_65]|uniref:hypothetical protein n=1 Tax=Pedobacter sp. UC225_65 TaxID=3350173 RepID=UPI003671EF76